MAKGSECKACNVLLSTVNQIGFIIGSIEAANMSVSHRPGGTADNNKLFSQAYFVVEWNLIEDPFIADLDLDYELVKSRLALLAAVNIWQGTTSCYALKKSWKAKLCTQAKSSGAQIELSFEIYFGRAVFYAFTGCLVHRFCSCELT